MSEIYDLWMVRRSFGKVIRILGEIETKVSQNRVQMKDIHNNFIAMVQLTMAQLEADRIGNIFVHLNDRRNMTALAKTSENIKNIYDIIYNRYIFRNESTPLARKIERLRTNLRLSWNRTIEIIASYHKVERQAETGIKVLKFI